MKQQNFVSRYNLPNVIWFLRSNKKRKMLETLQSRLKELCPEVLRAAIAAADEREARRKSVWSTICTSESKGFKLDLGIQ